MIPKPSSFVTVEVPTCPRSSQSAKRSLSSQPMTACLASPKPATDGSLLPSWATRLDPPGINWASTSGSASGSSFWVVVEVDVGCAVGVDGDGNVVGMDVVVVFGAQQN